MHWWKQELISGRTVSCLRSALDQERDRIESRPVAESSNSRESSKRELVSATVDPSALRSRTRAFKRAVNQGAGSRERKREPRARRGRFERTLLTSSLGVRIRHGPRVPQTNRTGRCLAGLSAGGIKENAPALSREGVHGSPGRIRTYDQVVNSHLLYR